MVQADGFLEAHSLAVLEYPRLLEILKRYAVSEPAREILDRLRPLDSPDEINGRLARAQEMLNLVTLRGGAPLDTVLDIEEAVALSSKTGAILPPLDIRQIGRVLRAGRLLKSYLAAQQQSCPLLYADMAELDTYEALERRIFSAFDGSGNVLDEASRELARIRHDSAAARRHTIARLEGLMHDQAYRAGVQEDIVTQRSERYVIPLKAGADPHLKGIVHDRSASGATFFVEPLEVVQDNNRLAWLAAEEKAEIDRILARFTQEIGSVADPILALFRVVAEMDSLAAIGRFAAGTGGAVPEVAESGMLRLLSARHPLLLIARGGEKVVPLDLEVAGSHATLLISGPNAGGKTVALKTAGLVVLMLRSGIPVPVSPDSRVPLFGKVYADIGDEQSIEEALSTYSGHIRRMAGILEKVDERTLVLIDEMGAGTDPEEGGALAAALLEEFQKRGALSIVTTHLSFLKETAARTEGMVNASMTFDSWTRRPNYRLLLGEAGVSNPLMVAEEMSLPPALIERARGLKDTRRARLDTLLEETTVERSRLAEKATVIEEAEHKASLLLDEAKKREAAAREEARGIKEKARQETVGLLSRARLLLKEAERAAKRPVVSSLDRVEEEAPPKVPVPDLKAEVEEMAASVRQETLSAARHVGRSDRSSCMAIVGDWVLVTSLNQSGRVAAISETTADVLVGAMKLKARLSDLELVEAPPARKEMPLSAAFLDRTEDTTSRLNLLGWRVDAALAALDKFLDQSALDRLLSVTIVHGVGVHGVGKGALREAVIGFLKGHIHVADYRPGESGEGGAGVTVVTLR